MPRPICHGSVGPRNADRGQRRADFTAVSVRDEPSAAFLAVETGLDDAFLALPHEQPRAAGSSHSEASGKDVMLCIQNGMTNEVTFLRLRTNCGLWSENPLTLKVPSSSDGNTARRWSLARAGPPSPPSAEEIPEPPSLLILPPKLGGRPRARKPRLRRCTRLSSVCDKKTGARWAPVFFNVSGQSAPSWAWDQISVLPGSAWPPGAEAGGRRPP